MAGDRGYELYMSGMCCSEAVVTAACEALSIKNVDELADIASSFCGGMGMGDTCGILSGCGIVIGAKIGKSADPGRMASRLTAKLVREFQDKYQCIKCRDINAIPAKNGQERKERCGCMIRFAVERVVSLLQD